MATPAVFLDRDGTINVEKNYLYRIEDWEWIPGAIEAIKLINDMGYLAIVVTNQAGIARGYYKDNDVLVLHNKVDQMLASHGARIDAYYYCPHHTEFGDQKNCYCRKPAPGMLLKAQKDFDIDMRRSFLIGDRVTDIQAAITAKVKPMMVLTGYGQKELERVPHSIPFASNLNLGIKQIFDMGNTEI